MVKLAYHTNQVRCGAPLYSIAEQVAITHLRNTRQGIAFKFIHEKPKLIRII